MAKFLKISRSDADGFYIEKRENILGAVEGELDDINYLDEGVSITITIIDMTQEEFDSLGEFTGW